MNRQRLGCIALALSLSWGLLSAAPGAQAAVYRTSVAPAANSAPDANLYTLYEVWYAFTFINYDVCGSVPGSFGCYGSGQLTGFGRVGAMIEGEPNVDTATNTVRRDIYVVDQAVGGGTSTKMSLSVYRLAEVIKGPLPPITCVRIKKIELPLAGGLTVKTSIAADARYLFIGTDQGTNGVRVSKSDYSVTSIGGITPATPLSAISADNEGYVTTAFGGPTGGFSVANPDGTPNRSGTGSAFMLGTGQGLSTSDMGLAGTAAAPALSVRYDKRFERPKMSSLPDAGLFRMYALDATRSTVSYSFCGTLSGSSGCYASGSLGPFGRVGAMLEGLPTSDPTTHTVRRDVYIVDQAVRGSSSKMMRLYDYRLAEVVDAPNVSVTATRIKTIDLPVIGGVDAKTYLGASGNYLWIGSNQDPSSTSVSRVDWSVSSTVAFDPPINASLVSVDAYGFVTMTFGDTQNGINGFFVTDGKGKLAQDGGGPDFTLGTTRGLSISDGNLAIGNPAAMPPRLQVHLDAARR